MTRLLGEAKPGPVALALLALAAVAVLVGGFEHARLFHRGYAEVDLVGPLFLLNAISSAAVILLLIFGRPVLFVLGAIGVSAGSIVSIVISHTIGFFGFREGGYDPAATLIITAEAIAVVLAVAGAALAAREGKLLGASA